jgi:hypothetical protein
LLIWLGSLPTCRRPPLSVTISTPCRKFLKVGLKVVKTCSDRSAVDLESLLSVVDRRRRSRNLFPLRFAPVPKRNTREVNVY